MENARQEFEQAVALDPEYAMAHSGLGATYALRIINRRAPDDVQKSQTHLQRALELDPELAEPYPWLCFLSMRQSQPEKALQAGHRAIQLQPDLVHAHYFLGLAYFTACEADPNSYQAAAKHLLQATRVGPQWQPSWFVLSWLALLNGDYPHAEQFAHQLLNMRQNTVGLPFVGAELVLASIKLRQRDASAARELLSGFLEQMTASDHMYRDSMSAVAACLLGDTEMREGRSAEALHAYRRAWHTIQEHSRVVAYYRISARAQAGLASAYAAIGERDRAAGLLQKALHLASQGESIEHSSAAANLAELHYSLAVACMRMGDQQQALGRLSHAVQAGWRDAAWLEADPELTLLRGEPAFLEALDQIRRSAKVAFAQTE